MNFAPEIRSISIVDPVAKFIVNVSGSLTVGDRHAIEFRLDETCGSIRADQDEEERR
jgi:urease accessory protein UreH